MKYDKCEQCSGPIREQKVRVDHRWKGLLIVVEGVPVGVCSRCGERHYAAAVLKTLDRIAQTKVGTLRELKVPVASYSRAVAA